MHVPASLPRIPVGGRTPVTIAPASRMKLRPHLTVLINGVPTQVFSLRTAHGVDQPIATATIDLPLPLPAHLRGEADTNVLRKQVHIQAGYKESIMRNVFAGYVDADRMMVDPNARTATLQLVGFASRLDWPEERDLIWQGPVLLEAIIQAMCVRRGVPYRIDRILSPTGQRIVLGANPDINDGKVVIGRRTSPLRWIARTCELFGYRAFETPNDGFRVHRVSGRPTLGPLVTAGDGVLAHRLERVRTLSDMVTYWTVEGPTYTDADGVQIPVRSFPAVVPFDPLLDPPGYRPGQVRDDVLVTNDLADAVRRVREIDYAAPKKIWSISTRGNSHYRPGATARVHSNVMDAPADNYWLMGVRQTMDDSNGYQATLDVWAGGGTALPEGEDLVTIDVRSAPIHLGDEYVGWYARPTPDEIEYRIPITVPDVFTSLAISLLAHSCNSHMFDGANVESKVSKIEVWQGGEKPVGTADLPVLPEDYERQLPYGSGTEHWTPVRMPVPGRLEAGSAEIVIKSGEHSRLGEGYKWDDFELRDIVLELRGAGEAVLPGGQP